MHGGECSFAAMKPTAAKSLTLDQIAKAEALVKEMVTKNPKLLKKK